MSELDFNRLMRYFRKRESLMKAIVLANKITTYVVFGSFIILLAVLLFVDTDMFARVTLCPLLSFTAVSVFRYFYNAKRPYEVYNFNPIVSVERKTGKSFPSRHVFSAFIIAFAFLYVNIPLGIVFTLLAVCVAVLRVLCGVHFIKDVLAGFIIASVFGLIGFVLI